MAGVFIVALILPSFRSVAYAPLRELIIPPPEPIVIHLLYSTEKEAWLESLAAELEKRPLMLDGREIQIVMDKTGSREMYLAILDGDEQWDMISPASSLQISILEDLSTSKFGAPIVDPTDPSICRPVLETPLVLVVWKDRADVLWGENPNGNLWVNLQAALTNPQGWAAYGHPEWSYIKFGHTDPTRSNSGFMTIVLMAYNYFGKTSGLTSADILSNEDFQQWLADFEAGVPEFGSSTGTYMRDIVAYGPSKYDIVAVYEATAIEQIENAKGRYGDLQVYYPPATIMSDHPFCLLEADWVSPEKRAAAELFLNYLTSGPAQSSALMEHGFRPVNPSVPLDQPESPLVRYVDNGIRLDLPVEITLPEGNVLDTLLTFWIRNIQR
jgi:ABC-type Fe3+ transport system substrate-binding protein